MPKTQRTSTVSRQIKDAATRVAKRSKPDTTTTGNTHRDGKLSDPELQRREFIPRTRRVVTNPKTATADSVRSLERDIKRATYDYEVGGSYYDRKERRRR